MSTSWWFWLGLIIPLTSGFVVSHILRRRGASTRWQADGGTLVAFWLLSLFMSTTEGHFDLLSFLIFVPLMTACAFGLGAGMRRLDRARGRDDRWD